MRLVCWNIQSATEKRWDPLLRLEPDIAVLPESARTHGRLAGSLLAPETSWQWVGASPGRGLAVAGFGIRSVPVPIEPTGRWAVAAKLAVAGTSPLLVLGIWSVPRQGRYAREVLRAIETHAEQLQGRTAAVMGDFNISGEGVEARGFHQVLDALSELGMVSAYHAFFDEKPGAESVPTYFHLRKRDRPFHIDYCFLSPDLAARVSDVRVGEYDEWVGAGHSDHVPLTVDLNTN